MQYRNPDIESSYRQNDLGKTLYDLVLEKRPKRIVEFGTLYGYSTVVMAMALDEIGGGHIIAYDLFEEYSFKHSSLSNTQKNIDAYNVSEYITLKKGDLESWLKDPEPFDLLHIDISNKGETIRRVYAHLKSQIERGALVVFEGGSKERDEIEWMKKYKYTKLNDSGVPYTLLNDKFPSISMITPDEK